MKLPDVKLTEFKERDNALKNQVKTPQLNFTILSAWITSYFNK